MNYTFQVVILAVVCFTCFSVSAQIPSYKTGFAHIDSAEYIEAKKYFRKAIDEYAELGKPDSAAAAGYYSHRVLFTIRDFEWDSIYVADTLAGLLAPFGKTGQAVLTQCKGEASFFGFNETYAGDQLDKAYPLLQESTPIDQFLVENRQMRAYVYAGVGELDLALKTMKEAVEDAENRFGIDGKTTGFTYRNLGLIHSHRDELPEAAEAYRKSLEILQEKLLPNNPNIPTQYINLAELYMQQSRHDLALETFSKAFEHSFFKVNKNSDRLYLPYSNWLSQVGLYEESLVWAKRADSARIVRYGEDSDVRSDALNNLGSVYLSMGVADEAIVCFSKALEVQGVDYEYPLDYAHSLEGIGLANVILKNFKVAKVYLDRAALVLAKTDQSATSTITHLKVRQAENEFELGELKSANDYLSDALVQIEEDDLFHTKMAVQASVIAAKIDVGLGDEKAALAHIRRSIRAIISSRSLGVTQHFAVDFAEPLASIEGADDRSDLHTDWLQLADILQSALRSQQFDWVGSLDKEALFAFQYTFKRASYAAKDACVSGDEQSCELAFAYADLPRAIALRQRANLATVGSHLVLSDSLLNQLRSLERERLALNHSEFNEARRTQMLDGWNQRNADFNDQLRRGYPGFYEANVEPLLLDVSAFRENQQSDGKLFLSFTSDTDNERVLRCALKGSDLRVDQVAFGKQEQQNLTSFLDFLVTRKTEGLAVLSHDVYVSLFAGLPSDFLETSQYSIVADGALQSLPWTALLAELPSTSTPMRQWEWLAKTHDVVVADAVGSFAYQPSTNINRQLTAIAPGFDADYQQRMASMGAAQTNRAALIRTPWTISTLEWLQQNFAASIAVGLDASEKEAVQLAQNSGILHLGTHAFYNAEAPLQSYFAFTPVSAEAADDGQLHAYELYATRINADLAVLPACNSGSGVYDANDGTLSLATAIRAAGCPSVVQSLWSIDDQMTNDLLKVFYNELYEGSSADNALANAQRLHISSAADEYQHPYYWAGLTVVGSSVAMAEADRMPWYYWASCITLLGGFFLLFWRKQ